MHVCLFIYLPIRSSFRSFLPSFGPVAASDAASAAVAAAMVRLRRVFLDSAMANAEPGQGPLKFKTSKGLWW